MASAEHEPITGVCRQSPQRGPGAEPLVRRSRGRSPAEAESILVIGCPTEPANLAPVRENSMFCYGPLVSKSAQSAWCPNPVNGGPVRRCPPPAPPPMVAVNGCCFQIYTEAVLSNSTRKLLWLEITKMLTAV